MVEIFWTDESKIWLKEIYDFIALDSPRNAEKVIESIIDRTEPLREFPQLGQRLMDWPDQEIRMVLYGHYRIVYLIKSEEQIDILGVYHSALDLAQHLRIMGDE